MRDHGSKASLGGHANRGEGFAQGADLVGFYKHRVGRALADAPRQKFRVGGEEIVADQLHALAQFRRELPPTGPVLFVEAVFDGRDRVAQRQLAQVADEPLAVERRAFAR